MRNVLFRILGPLSGLVSFLGAILVGWNSLEIYYLMTGRVQPGFEQPPLTVAVPFFVLGLVFLFGGWALRRLLRKNDPT